MRRRGPSDPRRPTGSRSDWEACRESESRIAGKDGSTDRCLRAPPQQTVSAPDPGAVSGRKSPADFIGPPGRTSRESARITPNRQSNLLVGLLAERQGFEPWVPARTHLISSQAHSAALAPLQGRRLSLRTTAKSTGEVAPQSRPTQAIRQRWFALVFTVWGEPRLHRGGGRDRKRTVMRYNCGLIRYFSPVAWRE